ncbi:thioredoxin [Pseudomaricurvus alkylphenolicus]|uniref:thioredoxin n=1 Tax=Pseudomaricurvus alkylphenolicus TaxID=1306991 RepID=UPI00142409FB|nr:thioredoxin [Pseudomaricurvus alkylphenolicus]
MSIISNISDSSFESDVLKSDVPVLVDFWAEWCRPCRMLGNTLDEIAGDYGDKINICKLDVDANEASPSNYGVRGIPTLMIFKNGEVQATRNGPLSKTELAAFIDDNV